MNDLNQNTRKQMSATVNGTMPGSGSERIETIVIGGGQAGLSVGYHLAKNKLSFLILDANKRIGDSWRQRWDSLRLFTPARYNGLAGMPFPAPPHSFPTKDEMAEFLEDYARHFNLPVRSGVRVEQLTKQRDFFIVKAEDSVFEAKNVVVAMANYQKPRIPSFARNLDPGIVQFHSIEYRNPAQLQDGDVLIVGAGNSGSEIGMEIARSHRTWMSGRDVGNVPFRINSRMAQLLFIPLVLRVLFHRIMTIKTFLGKKIRKKMLSQGGPLIRVKPKDMDDAGIIRIPKVSGVSNGMPLLEDGRSLDVKNVIWCTGYHPGFSWIDLPVFGEKEPFHERGVVSMEPGLYFIGLQFLYAASSSMVQGVERDAVHIVHDIVSRSSGILERGLKPKISARAQPV